MRRTPSITAVAWSVAVTAALLFIGATVYGIAELRGSDQIDALWPLSWVGLPLVGAMIASRRPRNAVGWIMLAIGAGIGIGLASTFYAESALGGEYAVGGGATLPAGRWVLWLAQVTFVPALGLVPFLVLVFPSGRVPPRWRRLAQAAAAVIGLLFICYAFRGFLEFETGEEGADVSEIANPLAIRPLAGVLNAAVAPLIFALLVFAVAVVVQTVWRFHRSLGAERRQLKWLAFAAAMIPPLFAAGVAVGESILGTALIMAAFLFGLNSVAAAIGIAVLRHRLYDIDRAISRTVTYAIVTAVFAGLYVLVVFVPVTVIGADRAPDWAIAVATLLVAALFRPVRRRVQNAVDHRFNRRRYDAEHTIEAFTTRLREQVDIDALGAELRDVVNRTMQPTQVSLWLK
jgi:hypothetical protein